MQVGRCGSYKGMCKLLREESIFLLSLNLHPTSTSNAREEHVNSKTHVECPIRTLVDMVVAMALHAITPKRFMNLAMKFAVRPSTDI